MHHRRAEQEADGSWFGRWGTNYIYGTWSVLMAFEAVGLSRDEPCIRKAVAWLESKQQADGSWGETNDSYFDQDLAGEGYPSCTFQTAWALLGLLAVGEVASASVQRGVAFLLKTQNKAGLWQDPWFTAPGFPKVFYLKYHSYDKLFPLWALAKYRNKLSQITTP